MSNSESNLYDALERLFHEPGRLAIMSTLCAADRGVTFNDLKDSCSQTDGNLSRHLRVLQDAGAVRIEKSFVNLKPRTTVFLTEAGVESFHEYLTALEQVLERAKAALPAAKEVRGPAPTSPALRRRTTAA